MKIVRGSGNTEVYLTDEEYKAYELVSFGKDLGLPPKEIFKRLQESGLKGDSMRVGTKAHSLQRNGASIIKGKGPSIREFDD